MRLIIISPKYKLANNVSSDKWTKKINATSNKDKEIPAIIKLVFFIFANLLGIRLLTNTVITLKNELNASSAIIIASINKSS